MNVAERLKALVNSYATKEIADVVAAPERIACVKVVVTYTDGEGL
jgi:hypothetical protein